MSLFETILLNIALTVLTLMLIMAGSLAAVLSYALVTEVVFA